MDFFGLGFQMNHPLGKDGKRIKWMNENVFFGFESWGTFPPVLGFFTREYTNTWGGLQHLRASWHICKDNIKNLFGVFHKYIHLIKVNI